MKAAGDALDGIRGAVQALSVRIADVTAAGREQATGVQEIESAIMQMDRLTQENAALTDRFASETGTVGLEIARLADSATAFRVEGVRAPAKSAA